MRNEPVPVGAIWARGEPCPFDEILDVRSPVEYAEDHHPAAVNLPVLSDAEREAVGTLYRGSPFEARKLGARLISANISGHLAGHFAGKGKEYRPLVYCFRGGQRSASLAIILAQIGWRVAVLQGGYKTYRAHVRRELERVPGRFDYRLLAGATGTAKTRLLRRLAERGEQTVDLEALANHRGSILGDCGPQPSQKLFESRLLHAFDKFDERRPVWVEAESSRIGNVMVPPPLWEKMRMAAVVEVRMPVAARVDYLLAEYAAWTADPSRLLALLPRLESRVGRRQVEQWCEQIGRGEWHAFLETLLRKHYDPSYEHSTRQLFTAPTDAFDLPDAGEDAVAKLVDSLTQRERSRVGCL